MLPIQKLFSTNNRMSKITFEGISHEESLREMNNCNSANWILGHLVTSRDSILSQIGLAPIAGEKMKEVYGRGVVKPDMAKAMMLDDLKKLYDDSLPAIMEGLGKINDEALLEQLTFGGFHEAYHLGQVGLIRKMLGKQGAIK